MSEPRPSFSFARRWNVLLNVLISLGAVFAIVAMVNYLAIRHSKRMYWAASTDMKLSQRTLQVLGMLTNRVHITIYYDSDDDLYSRVTGLLKEYQFNCSQIEVERVDYYRDAAAAKQVKAKYRLDQVGEKNLVIFDCEGRTRVVTGQELSDYDIQSVVEQKTKEVKRTQFRGEIAFTSAIFSVATPRSLRAYFLRGHGEHNPDSTDQGIGLSQLAVLLKDECNIPSEKLTLWGTNEVPADCSLLIIAGPTDPFSREELDKLQRYLDQGGRMLALFNYASVIRRRTTGLEKLLSQYEVNVGENLVVDTLNSPSGHGDLKPADLGNHPIMARLQNSVIHLNRPRSIRQAKTGPGRSGASRVAELLFTGPNSLIATDFRNNMPQETTPTGAVPLMVAVERGSVPGVSAERGATRLVVIGDSWLMQNEGIGSAANRDFAAQVVNWLVDQNILIAGVSPRPVKTYRILMTQSQLATTRWILLLGMPGGVLLIGALVWWRRRS